MSTLKYLRTSSYWSPFQYLHTVRRSGIYKQILYSCSFPERNKTPTPGLRTTPLETTESMAPVPYPIRRTNREVGTMAIVHEGNRRVLRHWGGVLLPIPSMAAFPQLGYFYLRNFIPNTTKYNTSRNRVRLQRLRMELDCLLLSSVLRKQLDWFQRVPRRDTRHWDHGTNDTILRCL